MLKIVFLVGDAPPHMDYANGPKYPELCKAAAKKDLIINTVQCGGMTETVAIWKEIAKLSEGSYVAIAQTGNMAVVSTPMDEKLRELNKRMGATLIPYGDKDVRREVSQTGSRGKRTRGRSGRPPELQRPHQQSVQGAGELLDALARTDLKLEDIDQKKLPAELQKLNREELRGRIDKAGKDRAALQKEIAEVAKEARRLLRD